MLPPTPPAETISPEIAAVLDQAPVCHVGFVTRGEPVVLPALHARAGDLLYLHGSPDGALIRAAASGAPLVVNAMVLDGIAVARTACRSALNYRSVLINGHGRLVTDPDEREQALRALTERVTPGGWARGRPPGSEAIGATAVAAIQITGVALRSRSGPAEDAEADNALPCWAGVVPLFLAAGPPVPAPGVSPGLPVPPVLPGCVDDAGAPGRTGRTASSLES